MRVKLFGSGLCGMAQKRRGYCLIEYFVRIVGATTEIMTFERMRAKHPECMATWQK